MSDTTNKPGWGDETLRTGREKLASHFSTIPHEQTQQISGWNNAWSNSITPWDRGVPNPALVDALSEHPALAKLVASKDASNRPKALVPGCGRGYDVLLMASHGFDAFGLDASSNALAAAREWAASHGTDQAIYPDRAPSQLGRGTATFIEGNFFEDGFLSQTHAGSGAGSPRGFDLIYDYTFLCALPPALRPLWAKRMSRLLAPGGKLVCLEHPLTKPPKSGGPPYGLSEQLYEVLFKKPGEEPKYGEDQHVVVEKDSGSGNGDELVKVDRWRPKRGFAESGDAIEDFVSLWAHRGEQ